MVLESRPNGIRITPMLFFTSYHMCEPDRYFLGWEIFFQPNTKEKVAVGLRETSV